MVKLKAHAKLDLAIHIERQKNSDGYYTVHYIDCQIELADLLTFEPMGGGVKILCDNPKIPKGRANFIWKAFALFKKEIGQKNLDVKITLVKNIPVKAGFGGGSSDAAVTILGLSRLFSVEVNDKQVKKIAKELGKDFYYSIYGGLSEVIGKGRDYKVVPIGAKVPNFWLLVVVPKRQKPSTGWVYENLKTADLGQNLAKFKKLKAAVLKHDKIGFCDNLTNDFESTVVSNFPIVASIKNELKKAGALATIMAGAGLSVVGFFESRKKAEMAKRKLTGKYQKLIITKTLN